MESNEFCKNRGLLGFAVVSHNRVVDRMNMTFLEMARCMLIVVQCMLRQEVLGKSS